MLKVQLFGRFRIEDRGRELPGLRASKAQELLAYLLLNRPRSFPRESLANLLWAHPSGTGVKKYLRQALWQLQSTLDTHDAEHDQTPLLVLEPDWLGIHPQADLWFDVEELESCHRQVRGIPGHDLTHEQAKSVKSAVDGYTGDLLEGCYEDWCVFERERLQHQLLALLDKLTDYAESQSKYEEGLAFANRILHLDRAREPTHQQLMRLHYLSGNRTEALRQFERGRRALREELDVEPGADTLSLYQQICNDQLREYYPPISSEGDPRPATLDRLRSLQSDLLQLMQQVQREVRSMELQMEPPH